ncbi:MAG: hypothetical protein AB7K71_11770 [Polyangiaceae bacterium]
MWEELLRKRHESFRKAGTKLHQLWEKRAPDEVGKTTAVALSNKLSQLHTRGDVTGWWKARPKLSQLLADDLGLETSDIFTQADPDSISFLEFPYLPGLQRHENPCALPGGGVFDLTLGYLENLHGCVWLTVPPGGGKSLCVRLLQREYGSMATAVAAVNLEQALGPLSPDGRVAVVEIEEPSARDPEALDAFARTTPGTVVLAPFAPPKLPQGILTSVAWYPTGNWRERLLHWVEERLERSPRETRFSADEVATWLDAQPEVRDAIQTPGDLLALCADFDLHADDATPEARAARWLETFGTRMLPVAAQAWSKRWATNCVRSLVRKDLLDVSVRLHERTRAQWTALVPAADENTASESSFRSEQVLTWLEEGGLLRRHGSGCQIYPRWVAEGLANDELFGLLKGADHQRWGRLASDSSRQKVVDSALDRLSQPQLERLARRVLRDLLPTSLASIAALESVTAAYARRISAETDISDKAAELAGDLLTQQLKHLLPPDTNDLRKPITRRDRDEWYATGWALSLNSTKRAVPSDLVWVLPGWAKKLDARRAPNQFPSSLMSPARARPSVRRLVDLTNALLDRVEVDSPESLPRVCTPARLVRKDHSVQLEDLQSLAGTWEQGYLLEQLASMGEDAWRSFSNRCWAATPSGASLIERLQALDFANPTLAPAIARQIDAQLIREATRSGGLLHHGHDDEVRLFWLLPPESRAAAVEGWFDRSRDAPVHFVEARAVADALNTDELFGVLDRLRATQPDIVSEFAYRLWREAPEVALEEAADCLNAGWVHAEKWFRAVTDASVQQLAGALLAAKQRPPWAQDWALKNLLKAGIHADALFEIAQGFDHE